MALNLTDNWQMAKILTDNWDVYPPPPIETLNKRFICFTIAPNLWKNLQFVAPE